VGDKAMLVDFAAYEVGRDAYAEDLGEFAETMGA
jgi:hypothetical protein